MLPKICKTTAVSKSNRKIAQFFENATEKMEIKENNIQ
jgi:hypothetical protein